MAGSKEKVAHLSSVHLAYDTRLYYRMCRTLTETYEVSLLACQDPTNPFEENDVTFYPYPRYRNRIFRVCTSWIMVFFKALRMKAQLYHIHDPELIPTALMLRMLRKKVVFDIHENIAEDLFDKEWIRNPGFYYKVFHFFEKFVVRHCYILLAERSYEKRYSGMTKQYSVIYNYCDVDFFRSYFNEERDPKKLFYSGVLFENRGVLQILEAIHLLEVKEGLKVEFHCVGELYRELRLKVEALPFYEEIKGRIHFHGRKKLQEAYELGRECGIGMSIIHPMSNSIESYPTKIFEYMAVGMPVLASNFNLYRELVEGNGCGLVADPLSAEEIKDALSKMINDREMYASMQKNGQKAVEKSYNWETEKKKLHEVYSSLLSKGQ